MVVTPLVKMTMLPAAPPPQLCIAKKRLPSRLIIHYTNVYSDHTRNWLFSQWLFIDLFFLQIAGENCMKQMLESLDGETYSFR